MYTVHYGIDVKEYTKIENALKFCMDYIAHPTFDRRATIEKKETNTFITLANKRRNGK